jgi:hypothetical protein
LPARALVEQVGRSFDTRRRPEGEKFGPDGAGPQHGLRLLLASLLGVLLGALLVSLTFVSGRSRVTSSPLSPALGPDTSWGS